VSPRIKKVFRDLTSNPSRSILVVLSMATGVFAVGLVAGTYRALLDSLEATYRRAASAHATLYFRDTFDLDLHETVRNFRGVKEAQARRTLEVRGQKPGDEEWRNLTLTAIADFKDVRINRIFTAGGKFPPAQDDVLMEQSALESLGLEVGAQILVETPLRKQRLLTIAGVVRDPGAPSSMFTGRLNGFVVYDTIDALGEEARPDQMLLHMDGEKLTRDQVQAVLKSVRNRLEGSGLAVVWSWAPPPGQHPLQDPINTLLLILGALGVLVLFLSGFLLVNTINAILTQQTRQIGIMKSMGATTGQIAVLYLALVFVYGMVSVLVAVPLGVMAARASVDLIAGMLNFEAEPFFVPPQVLALEVFLGFLVPLTAALRPVLKASGITVREAVAFYGVSGGDFGSAWMDRVVARVRMLTRPMLLSLRNTFRRKGRLALTLATLSMGGAIFMGVLSVRESMMVTIEQALAYWNYDVEIELARPYRIDRLQQEVLGIDGVTRAETWGFAGAQMVEDWHGKGESRVLFIAPPADTDMLRPALIEGRWLRNEDEAAVVINTDVLKNHPDVKVGDVVKIRLGLHKTEWKVVGMVRSVLSGPFVYANRPYYAYVSGEGLRASSVQISTRESTASFQQDVAKRLEEHFKLVGIQIRSVTAADEWKGRAVKQFEVIVSFLLVMAVLMAVVGALALMGTMGINVLERVREVGIIRAVGADTWDVVSIFILEGVTMGLISFVLGLLLSLPVGMVLGKQVGMMFTRAPLPFAFSGQGALGWLVLVVVLSAGASVLPALRAARLRVREVLAAE
jgi:putative ABC transport system permease protein